MVVGWFSGNRFGDTRAHRRSKDLASRERARLLHRRRFSRATLFARRARPYSLVALGWLAVDSCGSGDCGLMDPQRGCRVEQARRMRDRRSHHHHLFFSWRLARDSSSKCNAVNRQARGGFDSTLLLAQQGERFRTIHCAQFFSWIRTSRRLFRVRWKRSVVCAEILCHSCALVCDLARLVAKVVRRSR